MLSDAVNVEWALVRDPRGDQDIRRVTYDDHPTPIRIEDFAAEESTGGVRFTGNLRMNPRARRLQFDVYSDPEPLTVVIVALLATVCVINWKAKGGRAECLRKFSKLSSDCIQAGGSPDVRLRSTFGATWQGGFRLGCIVECDFTCIQT